MNISPRLPNMSVNNHNDDAVSPAQQQHDVPILNQPVNSKCSFQDLVSLTHLYALPSESVEARSNTVCTGFKTLNLYFYPIQSRTNSLDKFQECVMCDLIDLHHKIDSSHVSDNLNKRKRIALKELENNKDIVVRLADKRGNIVVLDAGLYCMLNTAMLSDTSTYWLLDVYPINLFQSTLTRIIDGGVSLGIIDDKQADYLVPTSPQIAVFHSFPKIHKGWFPPPLRPIVAGIGSLNEHLCAWLDRYLQLLIPLLPGYLRDTKQVLNALDQQVWQTSARWITAYVTSLYTAIPHSGALQALHWFLYVYSNYDIELQSYLLQVTEYLLAQFFFLFTIEKINIYKHREL